LVNLIVVALVLDVAADEVLVDTYRGDKVSSRPQRMFFVQTMGTLDLFLHPGRRLAFQYLHGIGDGVSGRGQQAEMDMVVLDIQSDDFPMLPLTDRFKDPAQFVFDLSWFQYLAAVFWGPGYVVFQIVETM
jgi:hypothetical protein